MNSGQVNGVSVLKASASAYFSEQAVADFASSLGPLGTPEEFTANGKWLRGGMVGRSFRIRTKGQALRLTTYTMPDGRLEQYQVESAQ